MQIGRRRARDHGGSRSVALLGLGAAARGIHLPACESIGLAIGSGADPDSRSRAAARALSPTLAIYEDPRELLERERPEWAIVAAPPAAHRELCLLALAAGAHVFCEKPFVERVEDADAILAAANRAGRSLAVNLEFPRMPIFEAARAAIGRDDFGRLVFAQFWQHLLEHQGEVAAWRHPANTMQEFGSHVVDLCVEMFGCGPEAVYARMSNAGDAGEGDLVDVVTLEFPGDRIASIVLDRVCRGPHAYLEARMDGERASIRTSIGGRARASLMWMPRIRRPAARVEFAGGGRAWLERGEQRRTLARNPRRVFVDATARHFRTVIDAVDAGREPPASGARARAVVAVVAAIYESARSGQRVRIADDSG